MSKRDFTFPIATLLNQAGRLNSALSDATIGAPVLARLPAGFLAAFSPVLSQVSGAPAAKAGQVGDTATLTREQTGALHEMLRLMASARRTAGLAFRGNHVVLREEFKVGIHEPQGLGDEIARARIILASAQKYATQLGEHGWVALDATDLEAAIATLGSVDLEQEAEKAKGPSMTSLSNADANKLYKNCLSIQNAARLQYPSTQPGNETPRARFLIGEFPPHSPADTSGTATPPAGPTPTP